MITLDQARYHLRIDGTDTDAELQSKLDMALAIVADYVGDASYSLDVERAAALLVLGELWMNRESSTADVLSNAVRVLLERARTPAFA